MQEITRAEFNGLRFGANCLEKIMGPLVYVSALGGRTLAKGCCNWKPDSLFSWIDPEEWGLKRVHLVESPAEDLGLQRSIQKTEG